MREIVASYPAPEEAVLYLERCHFTVQGLNSLLVQFTMQSEFPVDADRYDQLLTEYLNAYTEKELYFDKLVRCMVADEHLDNAYYTQEVLFEECEVVVRRKDATHERAGEVCVCGTGGCGQPA